MTDPIADFLTRIRNASTAGHRFVDIPASKLKEGLANILKDQGFIDDCERLNEGPHGVIRLKLRYVGGAPAVLGLRRVSRPGLRRYAKVCGNAPSQERSWHRGYQYLARVNDRQGSTPP